MGNSVFLRCASLAAASNSASGHAEGVPESSRGLREAASATPGSRSKTNQHPERVPARQGAMDDKTVDFVPPDPRHRHPSPCRRRGNESGRVSPSTDPPSPPRPPPPPDTLKACQKVAGGCARRRAPPPVHGTKQASTQKGCQQAWAQWRPNRRSHPPQTPPRRRHRRHLRLLVGVQASACSPRPVTATSASTSASASEHAEGVPDSSRALREAASATPGSQSKTGQHPEGVLVGPDTMDDKTGKLVLHRPATPAPAQQMVCPASHRKTSAIATTAHCICDCLK
jgi:hypothetical protein